MIEVTETGDGDPMQFAVTVRAGGGETRHDVTAARADLAALAGPDSHPADVVQAAFLFLLDREPKEAILPRFDLTVINRYFPEFPQALPGYLQRTGR